MKAYIFIGLSCLCSICVNGQTDDQALRALRARNTMSQFSDGSSNLNSGGVYGLTPSTVSKVEGDSYWDIHWGISSVELKGRKELVEGNYVRYDIYTDELEFLLKDGVKVFPGNKVVSVVWQDSVFSKPRFLVNGNLFRENGVPLTGFVEILVDNKIALVKRISLSIRKPSYNQALDVGSKNSKIIKEEDYYYAIDNKLTRLKSKKDLKGISTLNQSKIENYVKENKIGLSNERDLVLLIEYCNTLEAN